MLAFPADPDIDEVYTFMGRTWVWNGVGWAYRPSAGIIKIPINSGFLVQQSITLTDAAPLTNTEVAYI